MSIAVFSIILEKFILLVTTWLFKTLNACLFFSRQKVCTRFNFGYRPDMSDARIEVTGGHSPIINNVTTSRTAFSPSNASGQTQPLADQQDVWGPVFQSRSSFVEMHVC